MINLTRADLGVILSGLREELLKKFKIILINVQTCNIRRGEIEDALIKFSIFFTWLQSSQIPPPNSSAKLNTF